MPSKEEAKGTTATGEAATATRAGSFPQFGVEDFPDSMSLPAHNPMKAPAISATRLFTLSRARARARTSSSPAGHERTALRPMVQAALKMRAMTTGPRPFKAVWRAGMVWKVK